MNFEELLDKAKQGDEQALEALRNMKPGEEDIRRLTEELRECVGNDNAAEIGALLAAGANPKLQDIDGHDALWRARHPEGDVAGEARAEVLRFRRFRGRFRDHLRRFRHNRRSL